MVVVGRDWIKVQIASESFHIGILTELGKYRGFRLLQHSFDEFLTFQLFLNISNAPPGMLI